MTQVVKVEDITNINKLLSEGYRFSEMQVSVYFVTLEKKGE